MANLNRHQHRFSTNLLMRLGLDQFGHRQWIIRIQPIDPSIMGQLLRWERCFRKRDGNREKPYSYKTSDGKTKYLYYYESPSLEVFFGYDGHDGNDFGVSGTARAAASGKVVRTVRSSKGLGNYIDIYHQQHGYLTRYGHLESISVLNGQDVSTGDNIGIFGKTGN